MDPKLKHKVCTNCGFVGSAEFQIPLLKIREIKCPKCGAATMVELRSERGRLVLAQGSGQPRTWSDLGPLAH